MLGFDSSYDTHRDDKELAQFSHGEQRILLTRDIGVVYGYFVRATEPKRQVAEVVKRFKVPANAEPFSRCLSCNARLRPVPKDSVLE